MPKESVRDKIERKAYTPESYDPKNRRAYLAEQNELTMQFKADLLAELGLTDHPKAQTLWDIAWDERHANGLREVVDFAETLSELLS